MNSLLCQQSLLDLIQLAHDLSPFVTGTEGNVSANHKNGFYIKGSGTRMKSLKKHEVASCFPSGKRIKDNEWKPSIEASFHAKLLSYSGINFVAHTHPTNAVKILCSQFAEEFASNRMFPDQVVYNGKISCLVPYAHPGPELAAAIEDAVQEHIKENPFPKLILLQNHGIICPARTANECLIATEICEKAADIFCGLVTLGGYNRLSEEAIAQIENDDNEKYRREIVQS